eukprot:CAMPEP_0194331970 /NCGR_PEP_ID=MMETSP0171-20130528/57525_1 /TAXON_ID=218684 /ORGANISM="Corethron pennatum, Strain L29A3" /LENGTH=498 /DNA_ID=CAMNT_0039093651 /DNA_START=79 /DNA_END=1572 /DNA_ORIENTATION=-
MSSRVYVSRSTREENGSTPNGNEVEFTVKAEENLYFESQKRVLVGTNYRCVMLKNQRFASLFRQYANYHGLRKDDLEYYFVDLLENEGTPMNANLKRGDILIVRNKRRPYKLDLEKTHHSLVATIPPPRKDRLSNCTLSNNGEVGRTSTDYECRYVGHNSSLNNAMNEYMEFTIEAKEDLFLRGSRSTIRRVIAGTKYSCKILKTQRFSSLFQQYAKNYGLEKDDLEYSFVNQLENEDTPESVQLQQGSTILVQKKRGQNSQNTEQNKTNYFRDMQVLMDDKEHMDAVFVIDPPDKRRTSTSSSGNFDPDAKSIEIWAHKCVLAARGEYFRRKGTFTATKSGRVNVGRIFVGGEFSKRIICAMLEFVYCNRISFIETFSVNEILELMNLSNRWILKDLKSLCELTLITRIDIGSAVKIYCTSEACTALSLSNYCITFIADNLKEVMSNASFKQMENYPQLLFPVMKRIGESIVEPARKKKKTIKMPSPSPSDSQLHLW